MQWLQLETSNFVHQLATWSISLLMTNCPPSGRGRDHVTHFRFLHPLKYICNGYSSLITISARMLNKYGERTQPCLTPFLTRNHSDSVPTTSTLAICMCLNYHACSFERITISWVSWPTGKTHDVDVYATFSCRTTTKLLSTLHQRKNAQ